jgi:hypothetical protein
VKRGRRPTSKIKALTAVAEALAALPIEQSVPFMSAQTLLDLASEVVKLQAKARRALAMPWGNPNMAEAAKKGRAVRKTSADDNANRAKTVIRELRGQGEQNVSYRKLAEAMNRMSLPAPGGGKWYAASVRAAELREL